MPIKIYTTKEIEYVRLLMIENNPSAIFEKVITTANVNKNNPDSSIPTFFTFKFITFIMCNATKNPNSDTIFIRLKPSIMEGHYRIVSFNLLY